MTRVTGTFTGKYDCEFNSNPNVEIEDILDRKINERFSPIESSIPLGSIEFYQISPMDFVEFTESPAPSSYRRELLRNKATRTMDSPASVPRSPMSNHNPQLLFFLKYHDEAINHSHYTLFYDYNQLCTKSLLAIAEQYQPLRYIIAAFSALVYSSKIYDTRAQAFFYYAQALREMRLRLSSPPTDIGEYQGMVATTLLLSTFDVPNHLAFHR